MITKTFALQKKTLWKYLFSYLFILTALFAGFFFIVKSQMVRLFTNELYKQADKDLNVFTENFSDDLIHINELHETIIKDIDIILSRYSNSLEDNYVIGKKINGYSILNELIDSIVYTDNQNNIVYSSGKYITKENGVYTIYSDGSSIQFNLTDSINHNYNQLLHIHDNSSNYLLYLPSNYIPNKNYSVFYILNNYEINKICRNTLNNTLSSLAIIDDKNSIVEGIVSNELSTYLNDVDRNEKNVRINNDTSLSIRQIASNYAIVALISDKIINREVDTMFKTTYLFLALLGFVSMILIYLCMNITYVPLLRLTRKIIKSPVPTTSYEDQLLKAFSDTISENSRLQEKIDFYRISIQKSILDSIIAKNQSDSLPNEFQIDSLFNQGQQNEIFVVYLHSNTLSDLSNYIQYFNKVLPIKNTCVPLKRCPFELILLIAYPGQEQEKEEVLHLLLTDLYESNEIFGALSNSTTSPLEIPSLYENVISASKHWSKVPVVRFTSLPDQPTTKTSLAYPYEDLNEFSEAIKHQDFSQAILIMNQLFELLDSCTLSDESSIPDFFIRCVLIDLLTAITNFMNYYSIKFKNYSDLYYETLYLCRSCPYDSNNSQIQAKMNNLIKFMESEIKTTVIHSSELLKFMNDNYTSENCSIALLADQFHVSIAYMSYLFKNNIGENFSEYLWNMRLEKASELLSTTQMSIDEISNAIGYTNTSSFRRKFKQDTGISPSTFRSSSKTK